MAEAMIGANVPPVATGLKDIPEHPSMSVAWSPYPSPQRADAMNTMLVPAGVVQGPQAAGRGILIVNLNEELFEEASRSAHDPEVKALPGH
jgi:hypothetical protein